MVRTRDLVIFLIILLFVLLGIALTLLNDAQEDATPTFFAVDSVQDESLYTAEKDTKELDRDSIIDTLRNALSHQQSDIEITPSVEENEESKSDTDVIVPIAATTVTYCDNYDDTQHVSSAWPTSGISFTVEEGFRKVIHTQATVSVATTSTSTPVRTLIQLPLYPIATEGSCVGGEVVGITTAGALMYNSSISAYQGYGPEYLLGYARDGFPIYGYYGGELDACGGYMHASGYRYAITPTKEFILTCFTGAPASFIGF